MARIGDDAEEPRQRALGDPLRYLLLVDDKQRPVGWIHQDRIPRSGTLDASAVVTTSPLLDRRTTLKDALSLLLDSDVQAGVVVDRHGAVLGIVTMDMIAEWMRATAAADAASPTPEPAIVS
jgi:osmoprotectant transport system ATP-binding protein